MKAIRISRLFLMGLLSLLVAGSTMPAFANAPTREVFPVDETPFVQEDLSAACGFTVMQQLGGTITSTIFRDAQGNVTRILEHFRLTSDSYSANGHTIEVANANGPIRVVVNPDGSHTAYIMGTFDFTTAPGSGVISGSAGQTILTFAADGQLLNVEIRGRTVNDLSMFCAALAP